VRSEWRRRAREVIKEVQARFPGYHGPVLRAQLREFYPFGERYGHPYKIWLSEVRRVCNAPDEPNPNTKRPRKDAPGQEKLF